MLRRIPRALLAVAIAGTAVLAACESDEDAPPTNPLAETSTATRSPSPSVTATPTPSATPTASASPTATPDGEPTPPSGDALELAAGNAIEFMAEFLAVPATDLAIAESEAVIWPDSCMRVNRPGIGCDDALTPGFRIVLRDRFDGLHTIHSAESGAALWVGEDEAEGVIAALAGNEITIEPDEGSGVLPVLAVPGSLIANPATLELGRDQLEVGQRVHFAYDASPTDGELPVLARLTILE